MGELKSKLLERMAKKEEFVGSFLNLTYGNQQDRPIIKYVFDQIINVGVKPGQRVNLIDYFEMQNRIKPSFDIEHLQCRSFAKNDEELEFLDEIGNLLVIPRQINGILGNSNFDKKIKIFLNPEKYDNNIKHVPDFVRVFAQNNKGKLNWSNEDIKKRTIELAALSFDAASKHYKY